MSERSKRATAFVGWLLVGLSPCMSLPAQARGETGEESALAEMQSRQAPLALSADGQWRLHVDASNLLHRVRLADEKQAQAFELPVPALRIAASRSGRRVAFTSAGSTCVGLVEFDAKGAGTSKLTWLPGAPPRPIAPTPDAAPAAAEAAALAAGIPSEAECGGMAMADSPIAISSDGQWLATPSQVIDVDTRKVVASLPVVSDSIGGLHVLKLQFVDNDRKLLAMTATLGEGYESLGTPSDLQFAVWDLKSKRLFNLVSVNDATLDMPQNFFTEYLPRSGSLFRVDARRYAESRASLKEGEVPPPLEVMQTALGRCGAKPVSRFPLDAWNWAGFLIDPMGRWIAGTRRLVLPEGATRDKDGFAAELEVIDLDSRQQVARHPLAEELVGLVATPDGAALYGLTPRTIDPATGVPKPNTGGALIRIPIDLAAVRTPPLPTAAWDAAPCRIEDELPEARSVSRQARVLIPLWTLPVEAVSDLRQKAVSQQPEGSATCYEQNLAQSSFVMTDHSLWLDRFSDIARIDLATGRVSKTLPTPRKADVCSVPSPAAGGFLTFLGDTLSWRPFDAGSAAAGARQLIETRPGWFVGEVRAEPRQFVAVWRAKPGTVTSNDQDGQPLNLKIATYGAADRRRRNERVGRGDEYDMLGDGFGPEFDRFLSACHDSTGPLTSGHDWRIGYFGSVRGYACGPDDASTRTVFWSGTDIAPKPAPRIAAADLPPQRVWLVSGATGVAEDGGALHVFDPTTRRETAQIPIAGAAQAVWLFEERRLLVVESLDNVDGAWSRNLRAYSLGPPGGTSHTAP